MNFTINLLAIQILPPSNTYYYFVHVYTVYTGIYCTHGKFLSETKQREWWWILLFRRHDPSIRESNYSLVGGASRYQKRFLSWLPRNWKHYGRWASKWECFSYIGFGCDQSASVTSDIHVKWNQNTQSQNCKTNHYLFISTAKKSCKKAALPLECRPIFHLFLWMFLWDLVIRDRIPFIRLGWVKRWTLLPK